MTTYTATILRCTKNTFPLRVLTQERHLSRLFSSYYASSAAEHNALKSTASRFYTGSRLLPHRLLQYYADSDQPRCPTALYDDIESYVSTTHQYPSERAYTQKELLTEFLPLLPPEDRGELLCDPLPDYPSTTDLTDLMTRFIWYAVCNDRYEESHGKIS